MGLLNSALQVGRTAILGYEGALQVIGNNISSVGSSDYTRLSPQLDPLQGGRITGELQPGAGVALTDIQRNIDEALEGRLRLALGALASASTQEGVTAQIESFFDDLSGHGMASRLVEFFNAFDELRNTPEDLAVRDLTIADGIRLAETLRGLRAQLTRLGDDIDGQITALVEQADEIAREIARLNSEITAAEAPNRGQALALRDQRDALLRDLSELFDVSVREQPNGMINVYIGSETLIQGNSVRGLIAVKEVEGESLRTSVRFADTNQQVAVRGGQLEGLILSRDHHRQVEVLDRLASALIVEINRVHADGQGLAGFTSVTGSYDVLATDVPLDGSRAGLAFPPRNGSFYITVADDVTNTPVAYRIDVEADGTDAGTTLASLIADINARVDGVTASITSDNRLELHADDGFTFTFGHDGQEAREDTSGVLAALGINTFFTGSDARSIAINETLIEQPSLLAAASVFLPGDGENAGRLAALDATASEYLSGVSITDFYSSIANAVAVAGGAVRAEVETTDSVLSSLQAQRESISGVNLDEEAIALVKFQRAFQGAARFVSVVDELLRELVVLLR